MKKLIFLFVLLSLNCFSKSDRSKMHWIKKCDSSCCFDTRQLVLINNTIPVKIDKGDSNHCKVIGGVWRSFYSEIEIKDPKEIEIDHVLPFDWFYNHVQDRSTENLLKIYNDEENLVITTKKENRKKGNKVDLPFSVSEKVYLKFKSKQMYICNKYGMKDCESLK